MFFCLRELYLVCLFCSYRDSETVIPLQKRNTEVETIIFGCLLLVYDNYKRLLFEMSKREILEMFARTGGLLTPDRVWLGLQRRLDRRSVLQLPTPVEAPRFARNRSEHKTRAPGLPIDRAWLCPAQVFSFPRHLARSGLRSNHLLVPSPERAKTGWRDFGTGHDSPVRSRSLGAGMPNSSR